jgi:hypothetical protein
MARIVVSRRYLYAKVKRMTGHPEQFVNLFAEI